MTDDSFSRSENTDTPLSVTLKAGPGFAAPWVVIRGGTVEAVTQLLRDVNNPETGFLKGVTIVAKAFGDLAVEQGLDEKRQAAPAASKPAYSGGGQSNNSAPSSRHHFGDVHPTETCADCGQPMVWQATGEKNGKTWNRWGCGEKGHKAGWWN